MHSKYSKLLTTVVTAVILSQVASFKVFAWDVTPTVTVAPTATIAPTNTPTGTSMPTNTPTLTPTPTDQPTGTSTPTPTNMTTATPTSDCTNNNGNTNNNCNNQTQNANPNINVNNTNNNNINISSYAAQNPVIASVPQAKQLPSTGTPLSDLAIITSLPFGLIIKRFIK